MLDALFKPSSVAFIGGSNLVPALKFHAEQRFDGPTWIVNPKYDELAGFPCFASIADLPDIPDLAFVAIRKESTLPMVAALREIGCKAVVCNSAGFAETGDQGASLQSSLIEAIGNMVALGPNAVGLVNYADPMAAMMDHFGVRKSERGVAIVSQGGGLLCDVVFSDRGLAITHMVGCGNQAKTSVSDCVDYLLDDPRVTAVGLAFEGLPDACSLRRAAVKALQLGKPIVAIKFGKTAAGARAVASHTAAMTGTGAAWDALFDRLGIVSVDSVSELLETLKLFDSGRIPKGKRALVTTASGVMGVLLADHLTAAGFEVPPPSAETAARLRDLLPDIATPGNPQDITMAVWNNMEHQIAIYNTLLEDDYDIAIMVQNYPRENMWDISEYAAQVEALGVACREREVTGMQLSPLVDCYPAEARAHTQGLGLAAMQGLAETMTALSKALWWRERRAELLQAGSDRLMFAAHHALPSRAIRLDEAAAKALLKKAGVPVPEHKIASPNTAAAAAAELGFPVALKALDARLVHKTEVGAVKLGLSSAAQVADAVIKMRADTAARVPDIPLQRLLLETMATDVVAEVMASVSVDPITGPMLMIAGGGVEAELWQDTSLVAFPVTRAEVERALNRLKTTRRIDGYRGRPGGDRAALIDALMALVSFAVSQSGKLEEIEINPILVGKNRVLAVDVILKLETNDAPSV